MAVPVGYTTAQRAALVAAIASGTLTVSYGDKSVTYRSLAEMRKILGDMNNEIEGVVRVKQIRTTTFGDKGL